MKKILSVLAISMMLVAGYADARGGGKWWGLQ